MDTYKFSYQENGCPFLCYTQQSGSDEGSHQEREIILNGTCGNLQTV